MVCVDADHTAPTLYITILIVTSLGVRVRVLRQVRSNISFSHTRNIYRFIRKAHLNTLRSVIVVCQPARDTMLDEINGLSCGKICSDEPRT